MIHYNCKYKYHRLSEIWALVYNKNADKHLNQLKVLIPNIVAELLNYVKLLDLKSISLLLMDNYQSIWECRGYSVLKKAPFFLEESNLRNNEYLFFEI